MSQLTRKIVLGCLCGTLLCSMALEAQQVGIGTNTPATSAILDVSSTTSGLLPPRMTAAQRNAIASPANGLMVFDIDSAALMLRSAGGWRRLTTTATPGGFWGTNDGHIFNLNTGNVGIGVATPSARLDVGGNMIMRGTGNPAAPPFIQFYQGNGTFVSSAIGVQNDSTFGVLTNAGWALNVNNNNGRVGIGTGTPQTPLQVGNGNVVFGNNTNISAILVPLEVSGSGRRMIWYNGRAAFRAGYADTEWHQDSIGIWSFATGFKTKALLNASASFGDRTTAAGYGSVAFGQFSMATADLSMAVGQTTQATGVSSFATGYETKATNNDAAAFNQLTIASGVGSFAAGTGTRAKGLSASAFGRYNDDTDTPNPSATAPGDRIFQIGNGTADNARSNALTVLRNGNVGIGTITPQVPLQFAPAASGKKVSLYRGATGDAGFGVWPNEMRMHSDQSTTAITFGFDNLTNGFTERFRITPTGDLRMASDRQSIQFVSSSSAVNEPMMKMFEGGTQNPTRMIVAHSNAFKSWGLEYNDTIDQFNFTGGFGSGSNSRVSIQLASGFVGINEALPNYRLDVKGRIMLQGAGNEANSAGIWYSRIATKSEAFFTGMRNDSSWGVFSNNAFTSDWRFNMNARTGFIGLGNFNPNAPLHFNNDVQNRKIILYENANNDHQYYGFGINGGVLRYQTDAINADHVFYAAVNSTSSTELMRIKGNGAVGFNTDDPNVYGHGGANQLVEIRNRQSGNNAQSHLILSTSGTAGSMGGITWSTRDFVGERKAAFIGAAFEGGTNDALFQVMLRNNGNLAQRFRVNSNGSAWLQGSLTQNSDETLKKNIEPIANASDLLQQLHGYRYQWKDESADADKQLGLLAQEVQKVLPELVQEGDNGKLGVNYSGLIPVLLEALKEQRSEIDKLKALVKQFIDTRQ